MEEVTIALAIAALILAVMAICFEVFFYRWQTQQGSAIRKDTSDFAKEMHEILGHIRGVTSTTLQQLQDQFTTLLNAWIEKYQGTVRERLDEGTSPVFEQLSNRIDALEGLASSSADSEKVKEEVAQLKKQVEEIKHAQREAVSMPSKAPISLGQFRLEPIDTSSWYQKYKLDSPWLSGPLFTPTSGTIKVDLDEHEEELDEGEPTKKTRKKSSKTKEGTPPPSKA